MEWSIFTANILIHVGVMALFLTIFFFTVAQYFEKQIVEEQINFVIDDFIGSSFKPVSKSVKDKIKEQINEAFSKVDFTKQDNAVKEENSKVQKKAWKFVGILIAIISVIVILFGFLFKWDNYYLKFLFNSAIVSLIFVAITETLFMFLIAQNYLSADPNKIKLNIIETLANNRCDPNKPEKDKLPCIGSI